MIAINYQEEKRGKSKPTNNPEFAVVTSVDNSGLQLMFDGEIYPTKKRYKFNSAYTFKVGDRVKVNKQSGSYIVEYPIGSATYTLPPDIPSNINFSTGEKSIIINWSDPEDQEFAKWAGTYLVRNEFRVPLDENDGIVLVNNKIRNAYKENPFIDSELIIGKTYYYSLFTYSDLGKVNRNYKGFSVTLTKVIKYGVKIDQSNSDPDTSVEYLYDAIGKKPAKVNLDTGEFDYGDWGNVGFVKDCKPCMLKFDGTVDYYLNPNDYSKKEDGTLSDISDTNYPANVMVEFPLWYLEQYTDGNYLYIVISQQNNGSMSAYPFVTESGEISHRFYLSMFLASKSSARSMMSIDNTAPYTYPEDDWEYVPQRSIGKDYFLSSYTERDYINSLLIIMSKSTNLKEKFGYGPSTPYKNNDTVSAMFFGKKNELDTTMNVFYLKNWWGDPYTVSGMGRYWQYTNLSAIRLKASPKYYISWNLINNSTFYPEFIDDEFSEEGGFISEMTTKHNIKIPNKSNGSETSNYCSFADISPEGKNTAYWFVVGSQKAGGFGLEKQLAYKLNTNLVVEGKIRLSCHPEEQK